MNDIIGKLNDRNVTFYFADVTADGFTCVKENRKNIWTALLKYAEKN